MSAREEQEKKEIPAARSAAGGALRRSWRQWPTCPRGGLRELRQLTITMVVVAVLAVIALIFLIMIQVRHIIGNPVRELSQAATRIAEGELDQAIRYRSSDELGVLADDFNRVTLRLRDYISYIDEISEKLPRPRKPPLCSVRRWTPWGRESARRKTPRTPCWLW